MRLSAGTPSHSVPPYITSPVEPDVFHAQPIVDRVDEHRVAGDVGVPAGAGSAVIEDRAGDVLGHLLLDLPDDLPTLLLVAFHRLSVNQLVELGAAIAVIVALGITGVVLVERLIRLVETVTDQVEADREILFRQPRVPFSIIAALPPPDLVVPMKRDWSRVVAAVSI
jgi:hypothetical protein